MITPRFVARRIAMAALLDHMCVALLTLLLTLAYGYTDVALLYTLDAILTGSVALGPLVQQLSGKPAYNTLAKVCSVALFAFFAVAIYRTQ